jgi:hypothetical protein
MHTARLLARRTAPLFTRTARPALSVPRFTPRTMASNSSSSNNNNNASASTSATTEAPLQEWFVIAPDFDGALEKRLKVRPDHIGGLKADREDFWLWGGTSSRFSFILSFFCWCMRCVVSWPTGLTRAGAMLEEPIQEGSTAPPKMKGSAMLVGARTREEVVERLKRDVYVTGGVWDWDKVQIIPFKSALRKAL